MTLAWSGRYTSSIPLHCSWPTGAFRPHSEGTKVLRIYWKNRDDISCDSKGIASECGLHPSKISWKGKWRWSLTRRYLWFLWSCQVANTKWTHPKIQSIWKIIRAKPNLSLSPCQRIRGPLCPFDRSQKQLNKWTKLRKPKLWIFMKVLNWTGVGESWQS